MLLTVVDSHITGLGTIAERRTGVHTGVRDYEDHLNEMY